ncbi:MAG: MerR family transcriptional regulator [Beijerinckiaceae bacterium]|nr:MerR family transcriptional regulator [Beijerinckiaceae bacterium]
MDKSEDAFRTISEAAEELDLPQHVLRFWETRFPQIRPLKRGGGRRYYRPDDVELLRVIRHLLYSDGYTIKGVQRMLKERGVRAVLEVRNQPAANAPEATAPPESSGAGPADIEREAEPAPVLLAAPPSEAPTGRPSRAGNDSPYALARSGSALERDEAAIVTAPPARPSPPAVQGISMPQRHKLEALAAELAECRRILGAANI